MHKGVTIPVLQLIILFCGLTASFSQAMRQVIQSGFEAGTYLDPGNPSLYLRGTDLSVAGPFNIWSPLRDQVIFDIWNHDTYPEKAYYEVLQDPLDSANRVFMAELKGHNGTKGRAQGSFKFWKTDYPVNVIHFRFRWLIPEDWQSLREMDPHGWTDFFELWTHNGDENEFTVFDGAGTFRMNFRFEESGGKFIWHCKGEDRCYNGTDDREWVRYNRDIPIPFGKWAEFEVLVIKGPDPKVDPRSQARFLVRIRTGEGSWQTLFDVTDERTEHSYAPQPGYRAFQPVKNYTQANNIDYLIGKGLRPVFYYDDFDLYVSDGPVPEVYRYIEVPGRVEAESFSDMEGVALRTTTDSEGIQDVDSIGPSDWLEYRVNTPAAGPYRIDCRIFAVSEGGDFQIFSGDSLAATLTFTPGPDPPAWMTIADTLLLDPGNQLLRFVFLSGQWAFNWFSLEQLGIPDVVAAPERDTICSGDSAGILLESKVDISSGVQYHYSSETATGPVTGAGSGILEPGEQISEVLTNSGDIFGKVKYTITPYSLTESGQPFYPGEPAEAMIWVEPVPSVRSFVMDDTIHSGQNAMILWDVLSTATSEMALEYRSEPGSEFILGTGEGILQHGYPIKEELINNGTDRSWVAYSLIPYTTSSSGNPECPGSPVRDTVWVRPGNTAVKVFRPGDSSLPVRIFPNPAGDRLFLRPGSDYVIYNSSGMQIESGHGMEIDLSRLEQGVYFLATGKGTCRFIKGGKQSP